MEKFMPGMTCRLRNPNPEPMRLVGPGRFPVVLVSKGVMAVEDAWWADDADGRRLWWLECDLVPIGEKESCRS